MQNRITQKFLASNLIVIALLAAALSLVHLGIIPTAAAYSWGDINFNLVATSGGAPILIKYLDNYSENTTNMLYNVSPSSGFIIDATAYPRQGEKLSLYLNDKSMTGEIDQRVTVTRQIQLSSVDYTASSQLRLYYLEPSGEIYEEWIANLYFFVTPVLDVHVNATKIAVGESVEIFGNVDPANAQGITIQYDKEGSPPVIVEYTDKLYMRSSEVPSTEETETKDLPTEYRVTISPQSAGFYNVRVWQEIPIPSLGGMADMMATLDESEYNALTYKAAFTNFTVTGSNQNTPTATPPGFDFSSLESYFFLPLVIVAIVIVVAAAAIIAAIHAHSKRRKKL